MTEPKIDLHIHSHFSDGTLSPEELVQACRRAGVSHLSLTDHDALEGLPAMLREGESSGMNVLGGVEINTRDGDQIHMLGYGIRAEDELLAERLRRFRSRRQERIHQILGKLRALNIPLEFEEVRGMGRQSLGRPHVADALRMKKVVSSREQAFRRYLMKGRPAYVPPLGPSLQEAVETILEAGGIPVLAHAGLVRDCSLLERLVEMGLMGLEVYYPLHTSAQTRKLLEFAASHRLLVTGGSDFHGPGTSHEEFVCCEVPFSVWERLQEALATLPGKS